MKTHIVNAKTGESEIRDMTPEEEAKVNEDIKKAKEIKDAESITKTAKENNRTSGKAKLKSGEALTDDEISALFGDN
tara:strand:- start:801 stop:1031 length:231 start_codon:yes stop_codon:yes gene_type:complete